MAINYTENGTTTSIGSSNKVNFNTHQKLNVNANETLVYSSNAPQGTKTSDYKSGGTWVTRNNHTVKAHDSAHNSYDYSIWAGVEVSLTVKYPFIFGAQSMKVSISVQQIGDHGSSSYSWQLKNSQGTNIRTGSGSTSTTINVDTSDVTDDGAYLSVTAHSSNGIDNLRPYEDWSGDAEASVSNCTYVF